MDFFLSVELFGEKELHEPMAEYYMIAIMLEKSPVHPSA